MANFIWIDKREVLNRANNGNPHDPGIESISSEDQRRLQDMFYTVTTYTTVRKYCRAIAWTGSKYHCFSNYRGKHAEEYILEAAPKFKMLFVELEPCHSGLYKSAGQGCKESLLQSCSGTVYYAFRQMANSRDEDLTAFVKPFYDTYTNAGVAQFYTNMMLGIGLPGDEFMRKKRW